MKQRLAFLAAGAMGALIVGLVAVRQGDGENSQVKVPPRDLVPLTARDERTTDCRQWTLSEPPSGDIILRPGPKSRPGGSYDSVCKVVDRPDVYRIAFVPFVDSCGDPLPSTISIPKQEASGRVVRPVFKIAPSSPQPRVDCLVPPIVFEETAVHYIQTKTPEDIRIIYVQQPSR